MDDQRTAPVCVYNQSGRIYIKGSTSSTTAYDIYLSRFFLYCVTEPKGRSFCSAIQGI